MFFMDKVKTILKKIFPKIPKKNIPLNPQKNAHKIQHRGGKIPIRKPRQKSRKSSPLDGARTLYLVAWLRTKNRARVRWRGICDGYGLNSAHSLGFRGAKWLSRVYFARLPLRNGKIFPRRGGRDFPRGAFGRRRSGVACVGDVGDGADFWRASIQKNYFLIFKKWVYTFQKSTKSPNKSRKTSGQRFYSSR